MLFRTKIWILCFVFFACSKSQIAPIPEPPIEKPAPIPKPAFWNEDTWIYQQMKQHYLWANDMPIEDSTNKNLSPLAYFKSLLNASKDRYSYATEDISEIEDFWNGQLYSYGFRYRIFSDSSQNTQLIVSMVAKNSPAEKAGLKRGDIIHKIENQHFQPENIDAILSKNSGQFTISRNDSTFYLNLSKQRFQLQAIQESKILEIENKKIGYLAYNQFLINSNDELQNVFQHFKSNRIDELVVDLRFNPGGVTPMAETFASLLAPNLGTSYTLYQGLDNKQLLSKRSFTNETHNLEHLSRIYVLTSKSSASSSELIINCLRPYRQVITIGDNTYGKNLISYIISDSKFKFALMPAWTTIYNINMESDYGNERGLAPDFRVEDNKIPFYPLGDPKETLLNYALNLILNFPSNENKMKSIDFKDAFHHYDSGKSFLNQYL